MAKRAHVTDFNLPAHGWQPRRHQWRLWDYLQQGGSRAIAIWHRRAGKDEICLQHAALAAHERKGNYWHCLPEYAQGRKAIWTAINPHTGRRRIDEAFPPEVRAAVNDNEMFIRFTNGSTWQVIGSDRYDATMGASPAGIVYSEWALSNPSSWAYHRPMLEENGGWACFITTPRGHNHAKAMFDYASHSKEWFSEILSVNETKALSGAQQQEALEEYKALYGEDVGRAQFEQEYLCFRGFEMVICHDRAKPIMDVRAGDTVLTHTGRFRRVEETVAREYVGELVRIKVYGSEDIVCTPEHPVYTANPLQQSYVWKKARDITVNDWLVTPRLDLQQAPLITADLAIVIAWYISDGHVSGNAVTFSLGSHKQDCVRELCAALSALDRQPKVTTVGNNGNVSSIVVADVALADFLVGQCGSLAHHKRLPLSLLRGNEHVVWDTLFKGDGHIQKKEDKQLRYYYGCVSKGLTHQLVILGAALGYTGKIGTTEAHEGVIEGRIVNCRESYHVSMGRNETAYLNTRNGKTRSAKNGMLGRVRQVSREDYAGTVHNIKVSGDESYVVNGRAVHNCSFNAAILGAFYGLEMADVRREGRIDPELEVPLGVPVHRAWDIGVGDDTAIWWFAVVGSQLYIVDFYSASGMGVEHYAEQIEQRRAKYGWKDGTDYVPHDAKIKEWGSGRTRIESMTSLDLRPQLVPHATIGDGIEALRRTLPLCVFHQRTEAVGIASLEQYRREWDDEKKAFRASALHDWTSHGSDAARYMALAWRPNALRVPRVQTGPNAQNMGMMYGMVIPWPKEPKRGVRI